MHTSTCQHCGKPFEHVERTRQFCSGSCAAMARAVVRKSQGLGGVRKKTGTMHACEVCGKEFYRKAWQLRDGTGFLCSQACKLVWQSRNTVTRPCPWCGKLFSVSPSQATRVSHCSWACQVEGRSKTAIDRWHNGRRVRKNDDGYLMIFQPDHPNAYKDGWMPEHRWVVEQSIGRILETAEQVHHINGAKDDNRIENLTMLSASEHQAITNREWNARLRADLAELERYRARYGPLPEE